MIITNDKDVLNEYLLKEFDLEYKELKNPLYTFEMFLDRRKRRCLHEIEFINSFDWRCIK